MAIVRFTVQLPWNVTTLRGPMSMNTFHMDSGGTTPDNSNAALLADKLISLYGTGLDGIWGSMLSGPVYVIGTKLSDPKPRTAFSYAAGTLTPEAATLPGEVGMKVHYKAPRASGVKAQRFRGTMRLGPLAPAVLNTSGHVATGVQDDVLEAFETFIAGVETTPYTWVVGSEAGGWKPISTVHLSNELGTVGRRQFAENDSRNIDI